VAGRIIDLSKSGAGALGLLTKGTARVEVETIGFAGGPLPSSWEGTFSIQVGAFAEKGNADRFQAELSKTHPNVRTLLFETNVGRIYRVRLGTFRTEGEARRYLENLRQEQLSGLIVRED
jgi:rare lipoprotein A